MQVRVEFGGGLEILFGGRKALDLELPESKHENWNIGKLIEYLRENFIKEREELFATGEKIRPGILVLVNDVDYEIYGATSYTLKQNDTILFISTLHGG